MPSPDKGRRSSRPRWQGGTFRILDNTITADLAHRISFAINLHQATFEIGGNTITGVGGSRDPNDPATWPMGTAISISDPSSVTINRNQISGVFSVFGIGRESVGTGTDNVISSVNLGIGLPDDGGMSMTRSDFTNYVMPFTPGQRSSSLLRCNWWGSASGPSNIQQGVDPGLYTPWANVPIANSATACDPNAPPLAALSRSATGYTLSQMRASTLSR